METYQFKSKETLSIAYMKIKFETDQDPFMR